MSRLNACLLIVVYCLVGAVLSGTGFISPYQSFLLMQPVVVAVLMRGCWVK